MSEPFLYLFRFFRKNRLLFYLFLLLITVLIIIPASRIKFEENIGASGSNDTADRFSYVTAHHSFAEKLIITFSVSDTVSRPDPDILAATASDFIDSLKVRFNHSFIKSYGEETDDSMVAGYISYFRNNIPFYLDDKDYSAIEGWMNPDSMNFIMGRNYRNLITPAGFAFRNSIISDPLGLTFLGMKKMNSLKGGEEYDLLNGFIFTRDHRNLLLFITPANPPGETYINGKLAEGMKNIIRNITSVNKGTKIRYFGAAVIAAGNAYRVKMDIILSLAVAILLIILLLSWYFKSLRVPLLGFLPAIFGAGFALAVMAITKGSMSFIAMGVGAVILGLIVDYALYLITNLRKYGDPEKAITEMTPAILLCALTSAGAFLCLMFLKSAVLRDLGIFSALSVAGAALFVLIILPQFLKGKDQKITSEKNLIDKIAGYEYHKHIYIVAGIIAAFAVGFFFMFRTDFEKNMMSLNYMTPELSEAQSHLERITDAAEKNIYFVSTGRDPQQALRTNEKAEIILDNLKKEGLISSYSTAGQLLLSDSLKKSRLERWNNFWTPARKQNFKDLILSSGLKYGFRRESLELSFDIIDKQYKAGDWKSDTTIRKIIPGEFISTGGKIVMITAIAKTDEARRDSVFKSISSGKDLVIFDRQQITDSLVDSVKKDFDLLVILSMIFVTFLLLLAFGRAELALVSALPMYASWVITLGFMGITGIKFNIFNIILSSFIFGLGVDYSILMMRGLLGRYKYGTIDINSYKVSVFLSATTTIIGVASLFFAKHPAINSIALISVMGVAVVLLVTFTLQPYIFYHLIEKRVAKGIYPHTFSTLFRKRENVFSDSRRLLILNYIYKGPVLEWYLRVKMLLSDNYSLFDKLIPAEGKILDIGCGYGYISYLLKIKSPGRKITGIDYDDEKIAVAGNGFLKDDNINFECADVSEYPVTPHKAFLLSDVLHYLPEDKQELLFRRCIDNLEKGGIILIRDADSERKNSHKGSEFTEYMSTRVIKFNKTGTHGKVLSFTSFSRIRTIAAEYGLKAEIVEESVHTSNVLIAIRNEPV